MKDWAKILRDRLEAIPKYVRPVSDYCEDQINVINQTVVEMIADIQDALNQKTEE